MKVRKLTIQNINSIYGTWEIDFQHEAYLNTPLFAIVGKTGSGKSTILDAICFALYDQTDRMDKTRSAFASFNTTECMAELEFEINGKTYIAHSSLTCNENENVQVHKSPEYTLCLFSQACCHYQTCPIHQ